MALKKYFFSFILTISIESNVFVGFKFSSSSIQTSEIN